MNIKIDKLIENPITYSETLTIKELEEIVEYANYKYYNSCRSVMEDDIYDIIKGLLEKKNPDSEILKKVGASLDKNSKTKLPYWMGSMNKIKPDNNSLSIYLKKFNNSFIISDKLDGSSALFHRYMKNSKWINKLYTRGDGNYGRDITHLLIYIFSEDFLNNLPNKNFSIRGEIIISKNNFELFKNDKSNPRALTNGIVNCKNIDIDIAKHLDFIGFQVLNPSNLKPSEQYKFIESLSFKIPFNKYYDTINNNLLSDILVNRRKNSDYIIDGIIIQHNKYYPINNSGNPEHSIAFKMMLKEQLAETIVLDVEWNITRYGILKPVVIYESVILDGTTMQRASGFNAKYITENNIGPGTKIIITRSGDVIPYILKIISPTKAKLPNNLNYIWDNHDIILNNNNNNKEVIIKKLTFFIKTMNIKDIGIKYIKLFVDNGINTIKKLINTTSAEFLNLPRISNISANKFYNNINNAIKNIPLHILMTASQCFDSGLGINKFKIILEHYPNILTISNTDIEKLISSIKGFDKTAKIFADNLDKFKKFLLLHPEFIFNIDNYSNKDINNSLLFNNKKFVITGFRDEKLQNFIINNGGKIISSPNKTTSFVITNNIDSNSNKIKKASQLNIPIISIEDFKNKFNFI